MKYQLEMHVLSCYQGRTIVLLTKSNLGVTRIKTFCYEKPKVRGIIRASK